MPFNYDEEHLEAFQTMAREGDWEPTVLQSWADKARLSPLPSGFADQAMTRDLLRSASTDVTVSDRELMWGILAWGKMRLGAAARFKAYEPQWLNTVRELRFGGLTRQESYKLCSDTMMACPSGGIGPAYFTKLIFFANPRHDGYIMDQWTSRSVNLLVSDGPVVRMRTKDHVHPMNDAATYERYCCIVEDLSHHLKGKTPEQVEQCLFSTGWIRRQPPAAWRRHVIANG